MPLLASVVVQVAVDCQLLPTATGADQLETAEQAGMTADEVVVW